MPSEYESYSRAIMKAIRPITDEALADREDMSAWMGSVLTGGPTPPRKKLRSLRRDEDVVVKLFQGLTEIVGTVTSLENIPKLANHAPPKRTGVGKSAYLQLMVETYLGEVYILKERCDRYRTAVIRMYRNDVRAAQIKERLNLLGEFTAESFRSMVDTRGGHVHVARHDDDELARLRTLAMLSSSSDHEGFGWIEGVAFRATKASKVKWMNNNNKAVKRFLDEYFKEMARWVLPSGSVRFPKIVSDKS